MKLISIILPTYNGEVTLEKAVDSIIKQSYPYWELIIVNDCSTDNTGDIIGKLKRRDSRILSIENQYNQKLPESLNIGFRLAKGEYYTWTSDDNAFHEDALKVMIEEMENDREVDLVYADYNIVRMDGYNESLMQLRDPDYLRFTNVVGACFLYRSSLAEKIGEYNRDFFLAEDYEYWIRAYLSGKMKHLNVSLYDYAKNENSLTATRYEEICKQVYRVKKKYFYDLYSLCKTQEERNLFFYWMLRFITSPSRKVLLRIRYYLMSPRFMLNDLKAHI